MTGNTNGTTILARAGLKLIPLDIFAYLLNLLFSFLQIQILS